ncbi:hypothetical protein Ddye_005957 [Dipteronia dyeriana]|uniref:HAT C-terminal dimerisation domain-containing protein n=1 Tax=Dipteronia dyeriana TaxID=168575 RepID=A0AAE0CQ76_9ROSI|nr:hypothetical protein Ddye_005957 [Dipteronia dyeriana]
MPPPSDEFDADDEEKPLKSDLFRVHMKKIELDDETIKIICNYCPKTYKASKSFGYGTYWNHVKRNHPSELVKTSNQGQISRRPIKFSQDINTRWNSTYKLLDESVEYKEILVSFITYNVPSISLQLKHWDGWWKDYEQEYPILAIIAKQILGTPVSTVAVEQEFNTGGNILDPIRSILCPQSFEAQVRVDYWTKAKFRRQELEPKIVNDFFEDDQTTGIEGSE